MAMMRRAPWSAAALLLLVTVGTALAADQVIVGRRFTLRDPQPGGDATKRSLILLGKETGSNATLSGDPEQNTGGAVTVFVNGGSWTSETYAVPQGTDPGGRPFWRAIPSGFIYKDRNGTNGPVQAMRIRLSSDATFELKIVGKGRLGPIGLLPPNPGATACVRFDIGGGDSYHVLLPPEPSATIGRNDERTFVMRDAVVRGLCPTLPTTTSTTSSTTTSTNPTAVCGNGVREPGEQCDGGFGCTASCVQEMPSCCSLSDECISTPTFSLNFYLMQYCSAFLPGSQPIQGGICAPDGSCAPQSIDPVSVCCQTPPPFVGCSGATATSTNGLWTFQNVCRGAQSGTVFVAADCVGGVCLPQ
jgi:hypothetical protein